MSSSALSTIDSDQLDIDLITESSSQSNLPSQKRRQPRKAWSWNHMPNPDPETLYYDETGRIRWQCRNCPTRYLESGGTTAIRNHLTGRHDKKENSPREDQALRVQATIQQAFHRVGEVTHKRRRLLHDDFNIAHFEYLLVRWITRCSIPFRMVECEEFRALIYYINNTCDDWLPTNQ